MSKRFLWLAMFLILASSSYAVFNTSLPCYPDTCDASFNCIRNLTNGTTYWTKGGNGVDSFSMSNPGGDDFHGTSADGTGAGTTVSVEFSYWQNTNISINNYINIYAELADTGNDAISFFRPGGGGTGRFSIYDGSTWGNTGKIFASQTWQRLKFVMSGRNITLYVGGVQTAIVNISQRVTPDRDHMTELEWKHDGAGTSKIANISFFNGTGCTPLAPSTPAGVITWINQTPVNNTQYSNTKLNFTVTFNTTSGNFTTCNLSIDDTLNQSAINGSSVSTDTFKISYYNISLSEEYHNYSFYCYNSDPANFTSVTYLLYTDITEPVITTNFPNQSYYLYNNITAQFNFTDNLMLFSYNITLDSTTVIANETGLTSNFSQYNFSYDTETLTKGEHVINIRVADGHTAQLIQDYKVSDGLFNSYLRYEWDDNYVKIEKKGGGIFEDMFDLFFDNFETTKKRDRYTWTYEPWDEQSKQKFNVKTDSQIYIINKPDSRYKQWIIFDNKWMDFVLEGESPTINISRIAWNEVDVTISNIKNPKTQTYNSIGELNIITKNYTFYKLNATVEYSPIVVEGSLTTLILTLNSSNLNEFDLETALDWADTAQGAGVQTNISNDSIQFNNGFNTPTIAQDLANWTWYFNVSTYNFSISGNQSYISINITSCEPGDYIILNFTIYDEETLIKASNTSNASIKTDIILTSILNTSMSWNLTAKWNFSLSSNNQPELLICLANDTLNSSSFILDALTEYSYAGHVIEHNYIDNFVLTNATIPKITPLYDLATADSTSFLINYQDENYVYVEGAIIDVLRKYIGEGLFRSVEHAKTDESGQTRAHLVTEDVIYKFNVYLNGVLEYSTSEYLALCQAVPCVINLRKPYDYNDTYALINDNLIYDIDVTNRDVTFDFATKDGTSTEINMTIVEFNAYDNETVASQVVTTNAGSIILSVPAGYSNQSYVASVFQDGVLIGIKTFSLAQTPYEIFGYTGIIMSAFGYMILALMGLSSGIATIFLGIIGLVLMTTMTLFSGGNIIGLGSAIIWLVVAGLIIGFKLEQRRNR